MKQSKMSRLKKTCADNSKKNKPKKLLKYKIILKGYLLAVKIFKFEGKKRWSFKAFRNVYIYRHIYQNRRKACLLIEKS